MASSTQLPRADHHQNVTRKRSVTTAIGMAISQGTADQDVDQGLAQWIVTAEAAVAADTHALDHQEEKTGDATTEIKGEDRQIAVNEEAMIARTVSTATVPEDVMIVVAAVVGIVQTNGGPNTTIGDQKVRAVRRTEEEGRETALEEEVLMSVKTTGDLNPEKRAKETREKMKSLSSTTSPKASIRKRMTSAKSSRTILSRLAMTLAVNRTIELFGQRIQLLA